MGQENRRLVSWKDIKDKLQFYPSGKYYGVPRGGQYLAAALGNPVDTPEEADYIIDDIIDSGATKRRYTELYPTKPFLAPFIAESDWLVFPWEVNENPGADNITRLLQVIGEDPNREGLKETPHRYLKFMQEFLTPQPFKFTTFSGEAYDELVLSSNIPFFSMCEHHLAPFFGVAHIGYIPSDKIVGISKLPRTLDKFARRLQNQERITRQVAQELTEQLNPKGVAVVLEARHLCQEMRGIKKPGIMTTTSSMTGVFKDDLNARNEFLNLINKK